MLGWYAGPEGENIAQASNEWSGQNYCRFQNAEYDKLFEQVRLETDLEKAAEMFIQLNDILINEVAVVPIVNRVGLHLRHLDDAARGQRRHEPIRVQLLEYRQLEPEGVGTSPHPNPSPSALGEGLAADAENHHSLLSVGAGGRGTPITLRPDHPVTLRHD